MIDDVDYLVEHAERKSQILYIDSSLRDRKFHPNANEYSIEFEQPFRFVYGFDVLDASIPVTMYNVDEYNNVMFLSTCEVGRDAPYDNREAFVEMTQISSFAATYNAYDVQTHVIVGTEAQLRPFLNMVEDEDERYIFYVKQSLKTNEISRKINQSVSSHSFFSHKGEEYAIPSTATGITDIVADDDYVLTFAADGAVDGLIYFERHLVDLERYNAVQTLEDYLCHVVFYVKAIEIGNYDINTILSELNVALSDASIDVATTTPLPQKQSKVYFESARYFTMNSQKAQLLHSLGFDTYPSRSAEYEGVVLGSNELVFGGTAVNDADGNSRYRITSPGLVSLLGERFCVLRLKELESHMFGSFAYTRFTPGIGMFKMAAPFGGITNLRFDYNTVTPITFHPIGKVKELSFRFETSSGKLYNFRGVNHQLMVVVKYYAPSQKYKFTDFSLNPNYDPDIMTYMTNKRHIENHDNSDEEDGFHENKYVKRYNNQMQMYGDRRWQGQDADEEAEEDDDED